MSAPGRCASCGAGLALGARFCRGCGAAVEMTEAGIAADPALSPGEPAEFCPSCAVPVVPGSAFCHSCGARLHAPPPAAAPSPPPPPPAAPPPTPPQAPSPPRRRNRGPLLAAIAFLACLTLGGLVAGAAYVLTREDDGTAEPTADGPDYLAGQGDDGSSIGPDEPSTEVRGGSPHSGGGDPGDETPVRSQESGAVSGLAPGRYIQAGSFRSVDGAEQEVERLRAEGIDAVSVPADWSSDLLPGFRVLLVGPLSAGTDEETVLRRLKQANVSGIARYLMPSSELSGPEVVAGAWSGDVEESRLGGPSRRTTYRVDISIADDGERGTIEYADRGCFGSLTLVEETGYSLAYRESIDSGSCPTGGVWHLRPAGRTLTAVRLFDDLDREVMVEGDLPRV